LLLTLFEGRTPRFWRAPAPWDASGSPAARSGSSR